MQEDLKNLQTLLSALKEDHLGKSDFIAEFAKLIEFVKNIKLANDQTQKQLGERIALLASRLKETNSNELAKTKSQINEIVLARLNDLDKSHSDKMAAVDRKMQEVKDGKDADEEAIARRVSDTVFEDVQAPLAAKIEKDLPTLGEPIRDALELLEGDNRLDKKYIRGLDELIDELKKSISRGQGSNVAGIRFLNQLIDVYMPTIADGQILKWNATNHRFEVANETGGTGGSTIYSESETISGAVITTAHNITQVIGLNIAGKFFHPNEYDLGINTITISDADAAGYSGSPYTIIYQ